MVPFSCCCNYATVTHIGMQIFSPQISKTHLSIPVCVKPIIVCELELN